MSADKRALKSRGAELASVLWPPWGLTRLTAKVLLCSQSVAVAAKAEAPFIRPEAEGCFCPGMPHGGEFSGPSGLALISPPCVKASVAIPVRFVSGVVSSGSVGVGLNVDDASTWDAVTAGAATTVKAALGKADVGVVALLGPAGPAGVVALMGGVETAGICALLERVGMVAGTGGTVLVGIAAKLALAGGEGPVVLVNLGVPE